MIPKTLEEYGLRKYLFALVYILTVFDFSASAQNSRFDKAEALLTFESCYQDATPDGLIELCDPVRQCRENPEFSKLEFYKCSLFSHDVWDSKLNIEYNTLIAAIPNIYDPGIISENDDRAAESIEALRQAQRHWIKYRDNECYSQRVRHDAVHGILDTVQKECLANITAARTRYFVQETQRIMSIQHVPRLSFDPSCNVDERQPIGLPNKVSVFAKDSPERDSDLTGYINRDPAEQEFEMHIISTYDGGGIVNIGKSEKPVVLVLQSYRQGSWQINVSDDTQIANVINIVYEAPIIKNVVRISGVDEDRITTCPNTMISFLGDAIRLNGNTRYMDSRYKKGLEKIRRLTGLMETSYQKIYVADKHYNIPADSSKMDETYDIKNASLPALVKDINPEQTLAGYREILSSFPSEGQSTLEVLIRAMEIGELPVLHVDTNLNSSGEPPLDLQPLVYSHHKFLTDKVKSDPCRKIQQNLESNVILIGGPDRDTLECPFHKAIYIGGDGPDELKGAFKNGIYNPGPGDDAVDTVHGRSVIVLEKGWGHDSLTATCHSLIDPENKEWLGWPHKYHNFVVFGPDILPKHLRRESEKVIIHVPTGDKLTMKNTCFSFAFAGEISEIDTYEDIPFME